jgi:hypothetical protein
MYSGSVQAVQFLSKAPRRHQETKASSSREATAKARGPMPRRRLQYPLYEDSAAARIPCPPSLALVPFTCLTGDEGRSRSSPCVRDFGVLPCSRACDHRARRRPAGSPPPTSRRLPSCRSCVCAAIRAGPWRCSSQWSWSWRHGSTHHGGKHRRRCKAVAIPGGSPSARSQRQHFGRI